MENKKNDNIKVFISYSWNKKFEEKIFELAGRLREHGIDVVMDKWDLKEGQDKYVFMEQMVSDDDVKKVLIICEKSYMQKADMRNGGVGDETIIISPEVYGKEKQEKFIPIVFEKNEDGEVYLPIYLKSRIYIDLSNEDNYEIEYEKLIRNLYDKPLYKKPQLGKKPEWLEENSTSLYSLEEFKKKIKRYSTNEQKLINIAIAFSEEYINKVKDFHLTNDEINNLSGKLIIKKIEEMKPLRDIYFDIIEMLIIENINLAEIIPDFFENLRNKGCITDKSSFYDSQFEHIEFLIWEMFIGTIVILLYYKKYSEIYEILNSTYFVNMRYYEGAELFCSNFTVFRKYLYTIEADHKLTPKNCKGVGEILINREKRPIITKSSLIEVDILLYQLSTIFYPGEKPSWFPELYGYGNSRRMWERLRSKKYCQKLFPLLGVDSLEEFKNEISKNKYDPNMRYNGAYEAAPNILAWIKIDEVGSLN